MDNQTGNNLIKIIYIVAYSRSGSTLLDLIINSHSETFSIGEGGKTLNAFANLKKVDRSNRVKILMLAPGVQKTFIYVPSGV